MRLRQIEVFRAIMLMGTVSQAARYLHVSQPVVTRVLQHAELKLGFKLFERERGRMQPTPEALILYQEVDRVFAGIESMRKVAEHVRSHGSGLLRVAATPSLAHSILTRAMQLFGQRHPNVSCQILTHHTDEIIRGLLSYEIDVGFAANPPPHEAIRIDTVAVGRMVMAVPAGMTVPGRQALRLRDFLPFSFITLDDHSSLGQLVRQALQAEDLEVRSKIQVQTYSLARALVESGAGVAIIDQNTAVGGVPDDLALFDITPPVAFDIQMMRGMHRASSVLIDSLRECLCVAQHQMEDRLESRLDPRQIRRGKPRSGTEPAADEDSTAALA